MEKFPPPSLRAASMDRASRTAARSLSASGEPPAGTNSGMESMTSAGKAALINCSVQP